MRSLTIELSVTIFCFFASLVSENAYSEWYEFILIDENILIFDESEPEEFYVDNHTARIEKRYLKDFFIGEIADDLAQQGIEYLNPQAQSDITSTLNNVLKQFSDLDDDEHIFFNRYH